MGKFKLKKDTFDFGNKGNFDFKKKNNYNKKNNYKGDEYEDNEHNRHANMTEGTIEEQAERRKNYVKPESKKNGAPNYKKGY
tara:strand:- start:310 stop:555 length:246 start_codon:yes stop_codon:yes gene_type:complete